MRHPLPHFVISLLKSCSLCIALVLINSMGGYAHPQTTTGVIQGIVSDQTGAVVSGANVEVKNIQIGFARELVSDSDGRFVFLQLPPGLYSLTVSRQGFAAVNIELLQLALGQTISLNVTLSVGLASGEINITQAPAIDTTKTEASSTINDLVIDHMPISVRKFDDLLALTPGVVVTQGPQGTEISFGGQRGRYNNFVVDGGDYNNSFFGQASHSQQSELGIGLESIREFQVVASGASAEFGHTAGGIVNIIIKSGTNDFHGSLFHFQQLEALSARMADGRSLTDFHREQFGGSLGGPIVKDKVFFFLSAEQVFENLLRANLSEPIGPPCPVASPTIGRNETLIASNIDCQRLALLNFFKATMNQDEGLPLKHRTNSGAAVAKFDWNTSLSHRLSLSYNFSGTRNENRTFDVPTYGNSANTTDSPLRTQTFNADFISAISTRLLNEAHLTFTQDSIFRRANKSNIQADTAIGLSTTFRFGSPFFAQPITDVLSRRIQLKDDFSIIVNGHTIKLGGEWVRTGSDQLFRGFFTGRYIFDSVEGFLRYATQAALGAGFGPDAGRCPDGSFTDLRSPSCAGAVTPLLLFIQGAAGNGAATDAAGASSIKNNDYALYAQDKWQVRPTLTLNFGLRWDAQNFPNPSTPPDQTAYAKFLNDTRFPSDGTLPNQWKMFQPRVGFAWDIFGSARSVLRASWGIYNARQNLAAQVGSITTNGTQQQTITGGLLADPGIRPDWPGVININSSSQGVSPAPPGVRVFSRDYANPRVYTTNVGFELQLAPMVVFYTDFTHSKGTHLTRLIDANRGSLPAFLPLNGDKVIYGGPNPFGPDLGEVIVTSSSAKSLYRGLTVGLRKRFGHGFQLEGNYVWSKDLDDSNERDQFTDRSFNRFDFSKDYSLSDRDIRHKLNISGFSDLPGGFQTSLAMRARSAQPTSTNAKGDGSGPPCSSSNSRTRVVNGVDCGRNRMRKNNGVNRIDLRVGRPIKIRERIEFAPIIEVFNLVNAENNINPLTSSGLFSFDGSLREGAGDPRQFQFALKITF